MSISDPQNIKDVIGDGGDVSHMIVYGSKGSRNREINVHDYLIGNIRGRYLQDQDGESHILNSKQKGGRYGHNIVEIPLRDIPRERGS